MVKTKEELIKEIQDILKEDGLDYGDKALYTYLFATYGMLIDAEEELNDKKVDIP